ncbi:MAG: hypothetical protein ROR55_10625 [Devosia sp.]
MSVFCRWVRPGWWIRRLNPAAYGFPSLITSPADTPIEAADEFHDKTIRPNQFRQTDFTYPKVMGWQLSTTMTAGDVTAILETALVASGCDTVLADNGPRLLPDNGSSDISGDLADCARTLT